MKYCAITYAGQLIDLTKDQFLHLDKQVTKTESKFLKFSDGRSVAISDIRYMGPKNSAPALNIKGAKAGEEGRLWNALERPQHKDTLIANLYLQGETPKDGGKKLRQAFKKIWFEHIKRRPEIDKRIGRSVRYTEEEHRIINTPLEELMEAFEKTLQ